MSLLHDTLAGEGLCPEIISIPLTELAVCLITEHGQRLDHCFEQRRLQRVRV